MARHSLLPSAVDTHGCKHRREQHRQFLQYVILLVNIGGQFHLTFPVWYQFQGQHLMLILLQWSSSYTDCIKVQGECKGKHFKHWDVILVQKMRKMTKRECNKQMPRGKKRESVYQHTEEKGWEGRGECQRKTDEREGKWRTKNPSKYPPLHNSTKYPSPGLK